MDFDPETKTYRPEDEATFLFVTREGATGILHVNGQVTRVFGKEDVGQPTRPGALQGVHRGVMFEYKLVYEEPDTVPGKP